MSGYVKTITKRQAKRFRLYCQRVREMSNLRLDSYACRHVSTIALFDKYSKVRFRRDTEIEIRFIDEVKNAEIIVKEKKLVGEGTIDIYVHCNLTYYQLRNAILSLYTEEERVANKLKSVNNQGYEVYRLQFNKKINTLFLDSNISSYENVD